MTETLNSSVEFKRERPPAEKRNGRQTHRNKKEESFVDDREPQISEFEFSVVIL